MNAELSNGQVDVEGPLIIKDIINQIAATGDEDGSFNGFCGAESGYVPVYVPVSTVAPAALITDLEL